MSLVLCRIDDRLIHGQVTVGWVSHLHANHIIVCSNEVCASEWEQEMYTAALPSDLTAEFFSIDDTVAYLGREEDEHTKTILLVESLSDTKELTLNGSHLTDINVGGLHFKPNKLEFLPYVYLDAQDIGNSKELIARGVDLYCQNTPMAKKYNLADLLAKKRLM